jgi:tRNA-2-methylthio-N6-dimethylallyladenosine synthase
VQIEGDIRLIGEGVPVRIVRAGSNSLFGEWVKPGDRAAA